MLAAQRLAPFEGVGVHDPPERVCVAPEEPRVPFHGDSFALPDGRARDVQGGKAGGRVAGERNSGQTVSALRALSQIGVFPREGNLIPVGKNKCLQETGGIGIEARGTQYNSIRISQGPESCTERNNRLLAKKDATACLDLTARGLLLYHCRHAPTPSPRRPRGNGRRRMI